MMLKTIQVLHMTSEMSLTALRVQGVDTVYNKLRVLFRGHFVCFCGPNHLNSLTGVLLVKGNLT